MKTKLPLFYFKPAIGWVDDDAAFLDTVQVIFKDHYRLHTFNSPNQTLHYLATYQSPLSQISFKHEFTESDRFGAHHHFPVDINIKNIRNLLDLPEKSQEMAVLIVDYHMPDSNGVELCEKLKHLPIKKILLTGEGTMETAIEAFNQGLIDKFIKKGCDLTGKLKEYIDELIFDYFYEKSENLISHLEASKPSLLSDPIFVNYFKSWCTHHDIQEFYLINKQGSFLTKSKNGKLAYFIIMSEQEKNEFVKNNDELVDIVNPLLTSMLEGKIIPFFGHDKESWEIELSEWKNYFHPSQILEGRERYYWTVVDA